MRNADKYWRPAFAILLALFVILALGYSVVIPLGEAPDEVSHFAYVRYLVEHHALPGPNGAVLGESHQPPLYYLIEAAATFWVPARDLQVIANPDFALGNSQTPNVLLHPRAEAFPYQGIALAWHLARVLSILMGAVTVWATWRIANLLFPDSPTHALSAAALVAFLPGFISISSAVNNDNLIVMLSALGVLQTLRLANAPLDRRRAVGLGILLGLAALTKLSGLVLWPFSAVLVSWAAFRIGKFKTTVESLAVTFVPAALVASPWFLYNTFTYGDPLGWPLILAAAPTRLEPMTMADWTRTAGELVSSFWGRFGGLVHLRLAEGAYSFLDGLWVLSLLGWLVHAPNDLRGQSVPGTRGLLATFGLFWVVMLAAYVRWVQTVLGADQARQLFPGLPLLAIVIIVGLSRLFGSRRWIPAGVVSLGGPLLAASVLVYLSSVFAVAPQYQPVTAAGRGADFGQVVRLVDVRIEPATVSPGGVITARFSWQALTRPSENYWLLLQLAGKGGPVASKDGVPGAGRLTTDWWDRGQVYVSRHQLTVPEDVTPGTYALRVGLHPFGRWDWLPVQGQDMFSLGNIVVAQGQ